jgi:glyoxylase-like metal-dependent hydrolase (beta-lactamase superfamily II)
MNTNKLPARTIATLGVLCAGAAWAQPGDFADVEVVAHHAAGNVHYLVGSGGNIGLSVGDDGVVMVDSQFAPLSEKILAAIRTLSDGDIRFLINTHVHPDHTGGNENFGGMGIAIVANENVRARMAEGIRGGPPSPAAARPIVTYGDALSMHLNGEDIRIVKVPAAHTDGDSFIYFETSNVLHLGDVFRTGAFPVIDTANGGTAKGTIQALGIALEIADPSTVILPGHGSVSTRADIAEFLTMVIDVEARVAALVDAGMSLEQVLAADPTADYADTGRGDPARFVTGLYESLTSD